MLRLIFLKEFDTLCVRPTACAFYTNHFTVYLNIRILFLHLHLGTIHRRLGIHFKLKDTTLGEFQEEPPPIRHLPALLGLTWR